MLLKHLVKVYNDPEMNKAKIDKIPIRDPGDVLLAPKKVIQRMENIIQKYGQKKALTSNSFQKAREAWIASVYILGYSMKTDRRAYWIQENKIPQEDPDIFAYTYRPPSLPDEIGVVKETMPIEVFEYPVTAKLGIVEHVKEKLKNKFYHSETIAICYIMRPGEAMKLIDVINGLSDLKTTVREVWLLFSIDGMPISHFKIARVYMRDQKFPEMFMDYSGDYKELCKIFQPEFLEDKRGMDKDVKYSPSGKLIIVPLPEDKSKK